MQVEQFLENSARQFPDKVALICGDERLTYRQIEERGEPVGPRTDRGGRGARGPGCHRPAEFNRVGISHLRHAESGRGICRVESDYQG